MDPDPHTVGQRAGRKAHPGVRRAVGAAVLCVLFYTTLLVPPAPVRADGPAAPLDAKTRLARRAELRSAAGRWITHRARFPSRCPVCQGAGKVLTRAGRNVVSQPCKQCRAQGVWLSPKDYREIYYDMRTEAFRQLPGIQDALETQYKEASQGRPWPTRIARYRVRDWELVDDRHGIVWFLFNSARSATATYWIWSTQAKPRGEWCVYDERSDGPWPSGTEAATPAGTGDGAAWEAVTPAEFSALRKVLAGTGLGFRGADVLARGTLLHVRLEPRSASPGWDPQGAIEQDALNLLPLLLTAAPQRTRVETEWNTPWRDPDGLVRLKPTRTALLERAAFASRDWGRLGPAERRSLVTWREWEHAGWTRVQSGAARDPTPAEPPTEEVAPEPTEPPVPEPAAPEPAAPAPPPLPPTPAPPTERTPQAPTPGTTRPDAPAAPLSASGRKRAEAGVARMQALLAEAKTASDDGVRAHQAGAHDLWQEKVSEARASLAEIEEVWQEDVVAAMPQADEAEREEQANELYGSLWDEIYALKSVLRKTSAMR